MASPNNSRHFGRIWSLCSSFWFIGGLYRLAGAFVGQTGIGSWGQVRERIAREESREHENSYGESYPRIGFGYSNGREIYGDFTKGPRPIGTLIGNPEGEMRIKREEQEVRDRFKKALTDTENVTKDLRDLMERVELLLEKAESEHGS